MSQIDPTKTYRVSEICRLLNVGESSVWRWLLKGCLDRQTGERVKLQRLMIGGRCRVQGQALLDFINRQPGESTPQAPTPRTPAQRNRDSARAEEELRKMGC